MRRLAAVLLFLAALALTPYAYPQEPARAQSENARTEEHAEPSIWLKLANFAILAGVLGFLIAKNAGKFFAARTSEIQRDLTESAKAKREAEAEVSEMERRIAHLKDEIQEMRTTMRQEIAAEAERIKLDTERHVRKIQEQAEQDIEAMVKAARRELKMYSAALALKMAEEQLKGRVTREVESELVAAFIADLRANPLGRNTNN